MGGVIRLYTVLTSALDGGDA